MGAWSRNLGVVAAVAWLGACAGRQASGPPPQATVEPGDTTEGLIADLTQHHRYHHHSGVLMLLTMSLDGLGLPDEQQTRVGRLQQDLLDKMRPAGQAERELMGVLADGIADARIDETKVAEDLRRLSTASATVHDAAIDDLNELHRILTPAQRAALLDRLDAHWALWKQANAPQHGQLAAISDELALTPDQLAKLEGESPAATAPPSLPEAEVDAHLRNFETAFRADRFDARTLAHANAVNREMAAWGAQRLTRFCEAVNPLLTEEQRAHLATLLREHGTHDESQAVPQ